MDLERKFNLAKTLEESFPQRIREISKHACVSEGAKIGRNASIAAGVVIYPRCIIRDNVTVEANAVLGVEGMNYARSGSGELKRVRHLAELIVEDDVYIGSLTTVQRGTFKSTIIGKGSGIGPNCDIGHQVKVGRHVIVTGMTLIAGHAEIGDYSYIGAGSSIKNGVKIGKKCFVGIGSLVLDDVPDGQTVVGRPAMELEKFKNQRKRLKDLLSNSR